jgi:hypothetical protein
MIGKRAGFVRATRSSWLSASGREMLKTTCCTRTEKTAGDGQVVDCLLLNKNESRDAATHQVYHGFSEKQLTTSSKE